VKQMPGTSGPGPLLAMASTFRVFASAVDTQRGDERMQAEIARLVNAEGREAIIRRAMSRESADHRRQILEAAGIPIHGERIPAAVYQQQLDVMLAGGGLVPQITTCATAMERAYTALQGRPSTQRGDHYSALAELWCGAAALFPAIGLALAPLCLGLGLSAGGYCYAAYHYEC
jgi:hypothetical protein